MEGRLFVQWRKEDMKRLNNLIRLLLYSHPDTSTYRVQNLTDFSKYLSYVSEHHDRKVWWLLSVVVGIMY